MKENLTLNQDLYLPLRDVVYHTLREAILKGELEPGERLMEIHLANQLGVSRTPIREAIRKLEQEGLAITIPRKGAHVVGMTEKDLKDVLEIRDILDELAARRACENMTPEILSRLRENMVELKRAIAEGDVRDIVAADEEFHNVIYRAADNPKLLEIINQIKEQMYRYRYEYVKDASTYDKILKEHEGIIEGFEKSDQGHVKQMMHTHLENQLEGVRGVIRRQEME